MAATVTRVGKGTGKYGRGRSRRREITLKLVFSGSYAAKSLDWTNYLKHTLDRWYFSDASGYVPVYDSTNKTVDLYYSDLSESTDGPLIEVASGSPAPTVYITFVGM